MPSITLPSSLNLDVGDDKIYFDYISARDRCVCDKTTAITITMAGDALKSAMSERFRFHFVDFPPSSLGRRHGLHTHQAYFSLAPFNLSQEDFFFCGGGTTLMVSLPFVLMNNSKRHHGVFFSLTSNREEEVNVMSLRSFYFLSLRHPLGPSISGIRKKS